MNRHQLHDLAAKLLDTSGFERLSAKESYAPEHHLSPLRLEQYNAANALFILCEEMAKVETRPRHRFDEDGVCTVCGFDGAEHHHLRSVNRASEAPPCR